MPTRERTMTLRSPFQPQQLLFPVLLWLAAAALAPAQDTIILQDNSAIQGQVQGVTGTSVMIKDARGTVGRPLAQIKEVRMGTIPPAFAAAQKAFAAKDYDGALKLLTSLQNFRGLPAEWAQQMTAMFGDVYVEKGEVEKAEAAYKDLQKMYPGAGSGPQSEIGLARLAVAKKDFPTAKAKVEPVVAKALEEKVPPLAMANAYSQAFYIMGQIKEAEGDFTAALENYLRTVTLFAQDRAAVAQAQEKADALRKAHPEVFVP